MNVLDYGVLFGTLAFIVIYGVYKTRGADNLEQYLRGGNTLKWGTIGLSVMATQASAITFISTPGLAYESGMAFVQNYFGLPFALIIVSLIFIPMYYKLKVYTAYEFLERRFDQKTRLLGAFLFLVQRGLAAGITIYAPAIILSTILGWKLAWMILLVGILVIVYTVSGGTRAVSVTQKHQMTVILIGMLVAFGYILYYLSPFVSFGEALHIAGVADKLTTIDFSFSSEKRYTVWSGLLGGLFLALSYFGTDQSQVQRYLGGRDTSESKLGLMFNAVLKIPMQFFILLIGVLLYVFYVFYPSPVYFNQTALSQVSDKNYTAYQQATADHQSTSKAVKVNALAYRDALQNAEEAETLASRNNLVLSMEQEKERRAAMKNLVAEYTNTKTKDSDYVFLSFILNYLPHGLIGLLLAVILSAAMSSTSGELNALATTSMMDFFKTIFPNTTDSQSEVLISKLLTIIWGGLAIGFAFWAHRSENLIEMVNILGSIFYGVILGVFLLAFFVPRATGDGVFWAAVVSQIGVIVLYNTTAIGYLWFNVIGCLGVVLLAALHGLIFVVQPEK